MTIRLAAVATATATALALTLIAPSAFAQGAPVGAPVVAVEAGPAWQPRGAEAYRLAPYASSRFDSSAKAGNAAQPERLVPQYGNTSGGPAY